MGHSLTGLENPGRILSGFNGASTTSLGDIVLPVQAGPVTLNVQFSVVQDLSPFNYLGAHMAALHESHPLYVSSNGKLPYQGWANRPIWQPVSRSPMLPDSTRGRNHKAVRRGLDVFTRTGKRLSGMRLTSLEAGFIREVEYPDWLANVVVVPKKEGKCGCASITPTSIMHAQKTVSFATIDQIVDSTTGQGMLSFLDAFSGYHQIPMSPADEEKTAFITPHGLYCYKVMPFDSKTLATYQRLMTKIFKPLVGRTVEYGMKLNPSKCAFGVSAGKFLDLWQVALGRFIARFTDELRPFLAIRKAGSGWTDSCQSAFEKIKHCLMQPPILSSPLPEEKLYMYLAVSEWAISAALFRCPSPKEQNLFLQAPYFQAHPVVVLTDQPSQHSAQAGPNRKNASMGHRVEYGIEFQPRLSMKGQVMADFVLEYSRKAYPAQRNQVKKMVDFAGRWSLPASGSGVGLLLQSPTGEHLEQAIRWGSPPLTMKRSMRPSYPDWTSPWLYPSPGSGSKRFPTRGKARSRRNTKLRMRHGDI
ncbi:hypothetical protein CK203_103356 [Vitis vinifera]|uniref:Uncharacterized protein n=1 Tax=Vitis vinifera TaxID=29760 RepID=A0A438DMW7_VITVI|nr:hypothetical protein CK203_103356 [Vitis vinifera]